jgi:hypothetical protein
LHRSCFAQVLPRVYFLLDGEMLVHESLDCLRIKLREDLVRVIQSRLVEVGRKEDAVFDIDGEVVDLELLIDVLVLLAFESTAVERREVPVAISSPKVDFLNAEPNRDGHFIETVLVADVDVLNIYFYAFEEAENRVQTQRRSEFRRLGEALPLALAVQYRASAVRRSARRGLRLDWGFSLLSCLPSFVLLKQIMHFDHIGQRVFEVVSCRNIIAIVLRILFQID